MTPATGQITSPENTKKSAAATLITVERSDFSAFSLVSVSSSSRPKRASMMTPRPAPK
jgi:hypothetical protein